MRSVSKTIISLLFILLVISIVGFFAYKNKPPVPDQQVSHEFDGTLKSLENSIITASGTFLSIDGTTRSEIKDDILISISPQTKITRTSFVMPTAEELKKTNGIYEPEKLPKTTALVDMNGFRQDADSGLPVGIEVKSPNDKNIFGLNSFSAVEITYIVPTIPK